MHSRDVLSAIRKSLPGAACAMGLALIPGTAQAQSLGDKYWVELSGFWPDVNSTVQVNSKAHPSIGTTIDLESDLDLADRKVLPSVNAGARFGHWVIGAEYYSLHREGSRSIARDITFDDVTYHAGVNVATGFDSDIYRLTVGYNFIHNATQELGVAIGGHVTDFDVSLKGQATLSGSPVVSSQLRSHTVLAPLPTIGAYGGIEAIPHLWIGARVDWLSLKVGDYKGRLWNAQIEANYRIMKNVGLGVMYRYVDYRLEVDKDAWSGTMTYRFNGPAVVLRIGFK